MFPNSSLSFQIRLFLFINIIFIMMFPSEHTLALYPKEKHNITILTASLKNVYKQDTSLSTILFICLCSMSSPWILSVSKNSGCKNNIKLFIVMSKFPLIVSIDMMCSVKHKTILNYKPWTVLWNFSPVKRTNKKIRLLLYLCIIKLLIHFNSAFTQKCCNKISVHYFCYKYR